MSITGPCQDCQRLGSLFYDAHGVFLCPKHAAQVSAWEESKQHLLYLIAPAVALWYKHWKERGLSERELEGTFENLEPYLKDLMDGV